MIMHALHDLEKSRSILAGSRLAVSTSRKWSTIQSDCIAFLESDMEPWSSACNIDPRNDYGIRAYLTSLGLRPVGSDEEYADKRRQELMKSMPSPTITVQQAILEAEKGR